MTRTDDSMPGPLELMESARTKYTLALARLRRGPSELALLSLHGSLEDALRGQAVRRKLTGANESFPQLLDALVADEQTPLSAAEADGIRRMHTLRARVAHGEHLAVAEETIDAYQRLVARLLPRYGILVVGPEDTGEVVSPPRNPGETSPPRRRFDDVEPIPPRHAAERGRTTTKLERPPRERTAYPDDDMARYATRPPRKGPPERTYTGALGRFEAHIDRWQQMNPWLLPLLIIISVFLIGAVISISLQQLREVHDRSVATASAFAPKIITASPQSSADIGVSVGNVASTPMAPAASTVGSAVTITPGASPTARPGTLVIGGTARVSTEIPLNLRESPGTDPNIPVLLILEPNTLVEVVDGPLQADGFTWWKVRAANSEGWCAGEYLEAR
ncbi:MAG: SH3 domain-containing protein [Oscillochloris sp.]|nr:SH3 domain-containing protein [Oscillochloris sp.]